MNAEDGTPVGIPANAIEVDSETGTLGDDFPDDPSLTNYNFDGWYIWKEDETLGDAVKPNTTFNADTTVAAKFVKKQITITFAANEGDSINVPDPITFDIGTTPENFPAGPELTGCHFDGWYTENDTKVDAENAKDLTENVTVYAKFNVSIRFGYKLDVGDSAGSPENIPTAPVTIRRGMALGSQFPAADPALTGYGFRGWFVASEADGTVTIAENAERVTSETPFDADTLVAALFEKQAKITFIPDPDVKPVEEIIKYADKEQAIADGDFPENPERVGWRFDGWFVATVGGDGTVTIADDAQQVTPETIFHGDTLVAAKYTEQITVTFVDDNGDILGTTRVDKNKAITQEQILTVANPEDCEFAGWYMSADDWTAAQVTAGETSFDKNTDVYARYNVTVTFMDGENVTTKKVFKGQPIGELPSISAAEYGVDWYVENTKLTAASTFTKNTTATARYSVTVTFVVKKEDGTVVTQTPYTIPVGESLGSQFPADDPTLNGGYKFYGWFKADTDGNLDEEHPVDASTPFPENTTVLAKFVKQVTITFLTAGTRHEFTVNVNETVDLLENPLKNDATFLGWFIADADEKPTGRQVTNAEGITDQYGHLINLDGTPLAENADPVRKILAVENMTLAAKFADHITVRFMVVHPFTKHIETETLSWPSLNNEGVFTLDQTDEGQPIDSTFYGLNPAVSGYYFEGWYLVKKVADTTDGYNYDRDFKNAEPAARKFVIDGAVYQIDESKPVYTRDDNGTGTINPTYSVFKENTYVVAKLAKEVTIIFHFGENGQEVQIRDKCLTGRQLSTYSDPLERPDNEPTAYREGYRIEWLKEGKAITKPYIITESDDNAVFDAQYIKQIKVTYQNFEGTTLDTRIVDIDSVLGEDQPDVPETVTVTEGGTEQTLSYMGWYAYDTESGTYGKEYTAETILTEDVTLRATYGYMVEFRVPAVNPGPDAAYETVLKRPVVPHTALGWLPSAPYREGHSFLKWTNTDNNDVDGDYIVDHDEVITGHYEGFDIFEVTINYVINGETDPTDTRIVSIDSLTAKAAPVEIESPSSFRKRVGTEKVNFYPVVTPLRVSSDGSTLSIPAEAQALGVELEVPDSQKPLEVVITVPYKKADAKYTVHYRLLKLDQVKPTGAENYADDQYDVITTESDLPAVDGAQVAPEIKYYEYAEYERRTSGTVNKDETNVFNVYYTRKRYKLTYNTQGGDAKSPVTDFYGRTITLSDPPARPGYRFDGWYKKVNTSGSTPTYTDKVTGSILLNDDITLYAKWTPTQVNYTIVYMLEKYNNATNTTSYVYDSSSAATGEIGATVTAAGAPDLTGDKTRGYEKNTDTTKHPDSSVTVKSDGSTVLTVYYDLIRYTLRFDINKRNGRITMNGQTYYGSNYTIENVVLGQDVSSKWPATTSEIYDNYNNEYFDGWEDRLNDERVHPDWRQISKLSYIDFTYFEGADANNTVTWYAAWGEADLKNAEYWLQQADGSYQLAENQIGLNITGSLSARDIDGYTKHGDDGTEPPAGYAGGGRTISYLWQDNYGGGYIREDDRRYRGYAVGGELIIYHWYNGHWYRKYYEGYEVNNTRYSIIFSNSSRYTYRFYYDRAQYKIEYYYYNDRAGTNTKIDTKSNVYFEANINSSTYNYEPSKPAGVPADATWDGWYTDTTYKESSKYSFTTMPGGNLMLYAHWIFPTYKVTFYEDDTKQAAGTKYAEVTGIQYGRTVSSQGTVTQPPEREHEVFLYWQADGKEFFPTETAVEHDTIVVGHWQSKEITHYKVEYRVKDEVTGAESPIDIMPDKTVHGLWHLNDEVEEIAPYITGYNGEEGKEGEIIADAGVKKLKLSYEDSENVIKFIYTKKPDHLYYTVKYVLHSDPGVEVHAPKGTVEFTGDANKYVEVDGNYFSVTETAVEPDAEFKGYRPIKATDTLRLGTDRTQNVLTFYYTNGAQFTVSWLDMEGDRVVERGVSRAPAVTYLEVGETFVVDPAVVGYTLVPDKTEITKNGEETEEGADLSFKVTDSTDVYDIKLYYKKDLTVLAHSAIRAYNGQPLTWPSEPAGNIDNVTLEGIKSGHALTGILITGSQTEVGSSNCDPVASSITMDGLATGLTPTDFYNITCLPGSLTVTKINVVISVEPDRWTGETYDGEPRPTGFTNERKAIDDYIIISNTAFDQQYLETLWNNLLANLKAANTATGYAGKYTYHDYHQITINKYLVGPDGNYLRDADEEKIIDTSVPARKTTGLQIIEETDAGDYYEDSSIFREAAELAIRQLENVDKNYNIILYVRESRLEIKPRPLKITTGDGEKIYDGTDLKNSELTVTVNNGKIDSTVTAGGENNDEYTLATNDTVKIRATGSQLPPGVSQNIYEIDWGTGENKVNPSNYTNSEALGSLVVTWPKLIITVEDRVKAYGEDDPTNFIKVEYQPRKVVKDTDGNIVYDIATNKPQMEDDGKPIEIKGFTVTHWEDRFETDKMLSSYSLRLNDSTSVPGLSFNEILPLLIERTPVPARDTNLDPYGTGRFDPPGVYTLTPTADPDGDYHYDLAFVPGQLTSAIARVSNSVDANGYPLWTYHPYLVNGTAAAQYVFDKDGQLASTARSSVYNGAFDQANSLTGSVIIETLCDDDVMNTRVIPGNPGYTMNAGFTFNGSNLGNTTLRSAGNLVHTSNPYNTRSTIKRGSTAASLMVWNRPGYAFTVENIVIDGVNRTGEALIQATNGTVTLSTNATLQRNKNSSAGGALYVANGAAANINPGSVIRGCSAADGGAVYVNAGGTLTVTGGTITTNQSTGAGAGIYLAEPVKSGDTLTHSRMNISGGPSFSLNYANILPSSARNGGEAYPQARQDIYIAGYAGDGKDTSAASLNVVGDITSSAGSIWVWAEKSPHFLADKQFAKYDTDNVDNADTTLKAFRNAQVDSLTTASGEYLYGVKKDSEDDPDGNNVYWYYLEGSRRVILRKVNGSFEPLPGAVFKITRTKDAEAPAVIAPNGDTLDAVHCTSTNSGVIWIGELNYGTYYLYEATPPSGYSGPRWFILTVGDDTVEGSRDGITIAAG